MQRVYDVLQRAARTDTTVLVTGETGTGKELGARAVHLNSPRARRPFVTINCAALTETPIESELFGHERGAFTGAVLQKKGKFEAADGGSIFLDEIGELPLSLQAKLLRVLQEREFDRVGGTRPIKIDVRVIAATNRDLATDVEAGRFRRDLYFRLNVINVHMPPLRERREDIPLLADRFLARAAAKVGRRVEGISNEARECLLAYDWPGNVRELENTIERAVALGTAEQLLPDDLPDMVLDAAKFESGGAAFDMHVTVRTAKAQAILGAFERANGSYVETARLLGLHPNYLHRLIRTLDLKPSLKRDE
jgi:two-component system, NtrC family, response regulator HydG